jgi:hypothetical protein
MFITIADPVSSQRIHLNPGQKTAIVDSVGTIQSRPLQKTPAPASTQPAQARPTPQISRENLGEKTIDGIYAQGTRTTRIYPAGSQGNDRDITVINERWVSPEMGVEILTKTNDPRTGDTTMEVQNLDRSEPNPALFQVPEGYKIEQRQQPGEQQ